MSIPERCLTVKNPWAYLIVYGIKDVENRTWKTNYRGNVFIHASAQSVLPFDVLTREQFLAIDLHVMPMIDSYFETSRIIGSVEIVDCVLNTKSIWTSINKPSLDKDEQEDAFGESVELGGYKWILRNPVVFEEPILNVRGKLNLWKPTFEIPDSIRKLYL